MYCHSVCTGSDNIPTCYKAIWQRFGDRIFAFVTIIIILTGSRQIGPRQIGPRQIGPLENLAANWAPANRALFGAQFAIFWQIGPRQIGPLGGKLGPGKSGPGRLGPLAANWAPEI